MASPEHEFLSSQVGESLERFSRLQLYGITESERRKFDYSATLLRDLSRPLVAQVAWKHFKGIDKDVRTLLTSEASIKLYLVPDDDHYLRVIDEAVRDLSVLGAESLAGFRLLRLPAGFDADDAVARDRFALHLDHAMMDDVLFRVVFGHLQARDIAVLAGQGGIFGLRMGILYQIYKEPYGHGPSFRKRLGYANSGPIDKVLGVLVALGLITSKSANKSFGITAKGRTLVDVIRRAKYELRNGGWSDEFRVILDHLRSGERQHQHELARLRFPDFETLLEDASAATAFNAGFDDSADEAKFFSEFDWIAYAAGNKDVLPTASEAGYSQSGTG